MIPISRRSACAAFLTLAVFSLLVPARARAQGGPPFITNDTGVPGPETWEINIAAMPILLHNESQYQLPQFDINYGVGQRIQLTLEIPYVLATAPAQPRATGWSNAFPGVKWLFIDNKHGWNVSTFPQLETGGAPGDVRKGIADSGTRFLLPIEVQKAVGPIELNAEAGYYFPFRESNPGHTGQEERIIGFALGHQFTKNLELDAEIYNDSAMGAPPHDTTWDAGGRYEFHKGLIWLFMAGRSFGSASGSQPAFLGYFGVQILLDHNGRSLHADE